MRHFWNPPRRGDKLVEIVKLRGRSLFPMQKLETAMSDKDSSQIPVQNGSIPNLNRGLTRCATPGQHLEKKFSKQLHNCDRINYQVATFWLSTSLLGKRLQENSWGQQKLSSCFSMSESKVIINMKTSRVSGESLRFLVYHPAGTHYSGLNRS